MWNLSVCAKSLIARWSRKCTKFCAKRKSRRISKPGIGGTENIRKKSRRDRKSTRLNSSHLGISYAVFCLKKKNKKKKEQNPTERDRGRKGTETTQASGGMIAATGCDAVRAEMSEMKEADARLRRSQMCTG